MAWESIKDLPEDWSSMVSTEIDSLADAWFSMYQNMQDRHLIQTFNERLRREWSIETGIIERLYTIDEGTTRLLIEQGIDVALIPSGATDRPVDEVINIIKAQRTALDGLYTYVAERRSLSAHDIRSLHQVLLRNETYVEAYDQFGHRGQTAVIKGEWRKQASYTTHGEETRYDYCPPEQIQSEIDRLIQLHSLHSEQRVAPQVEAAWLHHRFVQIHPFQDGNGRVARCLATLVLLQAKRFPLVITRNHRLEYLDALREADQGNLSRLVRLFHQIEKHSYIQALDLSDDVLKTRDPVHSVIDSIASRYRERQHSQYNRVFDVALNLQETARQIFEEYAADMRRQFQPMGIRIVIRVGTNDEVSATWYSNDIVATAQKLDYFANLSRPRIWTRLKIRDEGQITPNNAEIVVSFHYLGKENRGVMIASVFLNIIHVSDGGSDQDEDVPLPEVRTFRETYTLVPDGFVFAHTHADTIAQRSSEFRAWLEQAIVVGLAEWQRQL